MRAFLTALSLLVTGCVLARGTTCGSKSGGPQDSPIATLYDNKSYPWTNNMVNWSCVYNVKDYGGSFESAQKAACCKQWRGRSLLSGWHILLYYSNLMIQSNIVIRGVPTTDMAKKRTNPGQLAPKTIFKCTFGKHIGIF